MPSVRIAPPAKFSSELVSGAPLVGGKLYTYLAGTSTPQASYTDYTGDTANANPVILDSRGECNLWLEEGVAYKLLLTDADDVTIWTVDGVNYNGASGLTYLAANGSVSAPSFAFSNSTGMGFYRIADNVLGVATAGAEAVRIDASQNVGVGVSPTTKLDVNGTGKIRGALTVTTGGVAVTGNSTVTGTFAVTGAASVAGGTFTTRGFVDNATAAAWNIDSSGRLVNNGAAQPAFAAYRATSTQTAGTTLIFNTEQFDNGAGYNTTTGVFTAPVAGIYAFSASAEFTNTTGGDVGFQFRLTCSNAGDVASDSTIMPTATTYAATCSVVVKLAASEQVTVTSNTSLSATFVLNAVSYSRFSGALLYGL